MAENARNGRQFTETSWRDRLGVAADHVSALHDAYEDELEIRDLLILKAVDAGWPIRKVATWAKLSVPRVMAIVARRSAELAS